MCILQTIKLPHDERPDQIANKIYDDESLDWVVLVSNNILNIREEWPLPQSVFDKYLLEKYGTYDNDIFCKELQES